MNKQLSIKQVLNTKKSPIVIYQLLKESIIPIFILLEEKCEKLKPWFIDFSRSIAYEEENERSLQLGSKESEWKIIKINWLENKIKLGNKSLNSLQYNYGFHGFKSSLTHQYFGISFHFMFEQYVYLIKINGNEPLTFSYDKQLNDTEKNQIISLVMNDLLEKIKSAGT